MYDINANFFSYIIFFYRSVDPRPIGMMTSLHMLIHLRTLVSLSSTAADHQWQLELLEFLMLHSYWKVVKESKAIKHVC